MTDDRRPTDWSDERLADAFLARAAARPTSPDLVAATLERVRRSPARWSSRPWLRSLGPLAAAAAIVVVVGAVTIGRPGVEPGDDPEKALGLSVLSVSEAIAIRDSDPSDREIAVRGYFSPAFPVPCPAPGDITINPIRLDCPLLKQWLLEDPERLVTRSSNSVEGHAPTGPAFHPVFPFLSMRAWAAAGAAEDPVELVVIGHFHDRRGHGALCGSTDDAACDGFVVDGIHSVAGKRAPASTVIDLEPYASEPRREPAWTPADVDRVILAAVPDLEILSRVALPGHRIREIEPALGTGALGIIDRPIAWIVTGLDAGSGSSVPVRRTFLFVDGTAEAYETVPWDVDNVGFVPFILVGTPSAPSASPVTLDVVDPTGRHRRVEIVDESGLLESAAPVAPGEWPPDVPTPGSDVSVSQVADRPNEIRLGWVGGACDGPIRFTIRPDGRTIVVENGPPGSGPPEACILVGIQRGVILTFSAPVPASEIEIVKSSAPSSLAPPESPTVSTVDGEPITVSEAIQRRDNRLDNTEIAVRGFAWSPAAVVNCLMIRPASPALSQCPDDLSWLAKEPQPASPGPEFRQPVGPAFNLLIRPETYLGAGPLRPDPVEVIAIGHFDDHRAAQCPADQIESCRRNFVVEALLDASHPELYPYSNEPVRPDPSIRTFATAADVAQAIVAPRGSVAVLSVFAVSGAAVVAFEPQAAESSELTTADAVWIVRYVEVGVEEERPVLKTELIIDGPIDSFAGSVYVPTPWRSDAIADHHRLTARAASCATRPPAIVASTRPESWRPLSGEFLPFDTSASAETVHDSDRSNTTRSAGSPSTRPTGRSTNRLPRTAAGPVVRDSIARANGISPASTAASSTPSAVSMPLIPFAASPNSTSLSTAVCGAWSVATASAVPSRSASRHAAASPAERKGGFTRSALAYGAAVIAPSLHGSPDASQAQRREPATHSSVSAR